MDSTDRNFCMGFFFIAYVMIFILSHDSIEASRAITALEKHHEIVIVDQEPVTKADLNSLRENLNESFLNLELQLAGGR